MHSSRTLVRYDTTNSGVLIYLFDGTWPKRRVLQYLLDAGLFQRCGHSHDCCGCWFVSYVIDFHHSHGHTGIALRFLQNV